MARMVHRAPPPPLPVLYLAGAIAVALDQETGREMWRYDAQGRRLVRVVYGVERVFFLDADCALHCVRTHDGALVGKVQVDERSNWGAALLMRPDGVLFVATSRSVTALDGEGRTLWKFAHADIPSGTGSGLAGLASPDGVVQPDLRE